MHEQAKLTKEAAEEADQKSFCDEEIGESKAKQADLTGKLDKTSARIQKAEADKAKLSLRRFRVGKLCSVTVSGRRFVIEVRVQKSAHSSFSVVVYSGSRLP